MSLTTSGSDRNIIARSHDELPYSRPSTPLGLHPRLGWVGLGAMGYPMAKNLASHSPHDALPLLAYNRTKERADALKSELGSRLRIAESLEQVARECDVIFTSLGSDEAVKSVYETIYTFLKDSQHTEPKIFVETSTIFPTLAAEIDTLISDIPHSHFVTSPVFGPPAAAAKAQLIMVMSGDYRSKKMAAYISVPAFARKVMDLGGNVEKAPTFKLLGNSMILGSIELMAEAMTLAEKSGCGSDKLVDFIKDFFPTGPFSHYASKMLSDDFDGRKGFAIDGGLKDATHIRRLTAVHNSPMPVIDIAHQRLLTARAIHIQQKAEGSAKHEILDWSALIAGSRLAAGLPGLDSSNVVVRED